MALTDVPDKVVWTQPVNVVGGTPTPEDPANEVAAGDHGLYYGASTSYQTVASWTVAAGKIGQLTLIDIDGHNLDNASMKVTIGAKVYSMSVFYVPPHFYYYTGLKLAAGAVVKVEAKAIVGGGGNEITVYAIIVGKEIG